MNQPLLLSLSKAMEGKKKNYYAALQLAKDQTKLLRGSITL